MKKILFSIIALVFLSNLVYSQSTITVTNGNDSGAGSLRQAVSDATSGDTIVFDQSVTTITLTSGHIVITKNLTISGGNNHVTITRSGSTEFRCFEINQTTNDYVVNLSNITFSNFKTPAATSGGAIFFRNHGTLNISDCTFSQNHAGNGTSTTTRGGDGGAIYTHYGFLNINNCTFSENYAGDGLSSNTEDGRAGGNGGAIYSWDTHIEISQSSFQQNKAGVGGSSTFDDGGTGGKGGAIYGRSIFLNIEDCTFNLNFAGKGGDAINDGGDGGSGGAICTYVADTVNMNNVNFSNNASGAGGDGTNNPDGDSGNAGSVYTDGDLFNFSNCIFQENMTSISGTGSSNGSTGYGGALYIDGLSNFYQCSFIGNKTSDNTISTGDGGAVYVDAPANFNQCVFENNNTGSSESSFSGDGGAVYVDIAPTNFNQCVFENNNTGSSESSYRESGEGGALKIRSSSSNITNSLFFNNFTGNSTNISGLGGAISVSGHLVFNFTNNTLAKNFTGDGNTIGSGGAIFVSNDSVNNILNNIVTFNSTGNNNSGVGIDIFSVYPLNASYNLIGDSIGSKIFGLNNLIAIDPLFVDTSANYFDLQSLSPCIEAGYPDTTGLHIGNFDLNGNARIVGRHIDMGAYEYENAIITGEVDGSPFYITGTYGTSIHIPFTIEGNFETDNYVTAILSDEYGSFENPIELGTQQINISGVINGTIPAGTNAGTGYRVKVYSSNPQMVDFENNGSDLEIAYYTVEISPTDVQSILVNQNGTELTVTETPAADSRQWKYSTTSGSGYGAFSPDQTGTSYTPNFATAGTYYVVCVSNFGGNLVTSNEVQINVGVNNIVENDNQIKIFPNPANSSIKIDFNVADNENIELSVFNTKGEIIFKSDKFTDKIDVSNYPDGIYFIKIITDNRLIFSKFVKKN